MLSIRREFHAVNGSLEGTQQQMELKAIYSYIIVRDTVYFPCNMSVESNFTFDLTFFIHEDSKT